MTTWYVMRASETKKDDIVSSHKNKSAALKAWKKLFNSHTSDWFYIKESEIK